MLSSRTTSILLGVAGMLLTGGMMCLGQVQGMRSFDNRVEGTNIHNNALQDFSLLAVHRNFSMFGQDSNLHVRFFLPRESEGSRPEIFVEASELQDSFHYFMHAKNSPAWVPGQWNVFEPWPTKDVIDRLQLQYGNIGVRAGYRFANRPPVYLPVDVSPAKAFGTSHAYVFFFVSGSDLQALDVAVTNSTGVAMTRVGLEQRCNKTFNPGCKLYAAGSTHSFSLDMSGLPQGEYRVRLTGHVPGSLTPTLFSFNFYHSQ
jgi:hypothetical protein